MQLTDARFLMNALHEYKSQNNDRFPPDLKSFFPRYIEELQALQFVGDAGEFADWIYFPPGVTKDILFIAPDYVKGQLLIGYREGQVKWLSQGDVRQLIVRGVQ